RGSASLSCLRPPLRTSSKPAPSPRSRSWTRLRCAARSSPSRGGTRARPPVSRRRSWPPSRRFATSSRAGRARPPQSLVARESDQHGPELGPAVGPGKRAAQRLQISPHRLQLAEDLLCSRLIQRLGSRLAELLESGERLEMIG